MDKMNDAAAVRAQYARPDPLAARISLHRKYSVNRQGFGPWIASHYQFPQDACVLEVGCGNGDMWKDQQALIRRCRSLTLSDSSEGMVRAAREALGESSGIAFCVADIQALPFPDDSFDAVIANMMLYHVPDLDRALGEVRRVLKAGGTFYCATYGENGVMNFLRGLFAGYAAAPRSSGSFTLQNGEEKLRKFFSSVTRHDYPDSLAVTCLEDLMAYMESLAALSDINLLPRATVRSVLERSMRDGVLTIPKEYGMFLSR